MVHSKPEYSESVKLLTFSQLRKLEKIDAKKEREKALIEAGKEGIIAVGRAAEGLFSNQIAGTAAFVLIATAAYPAWQPIVWGSLSVLAKNLRDAWINGVAALPNISPTGSTPHNDSPPDNPDKNNGKILGWGIQIVDINGAPLIGHDRWYTSQSERDTAFNLLQIPFLGAGEGDPVGFLNGNSYRKVVAVAQGGGTVTSPG